MSVSARIMRLRRFLQYQLWVRPALASLFSIFMAGIAFWAGQISDSAVGLKIDEDSLITLFTIFASSMLTVATFTVSAIVTAASTAASTTTPRAARHVVSDGKAQLVPSAFIAAFIYSFIAIIALQVVTYGPTGRFVLFAGLVILVVFVLVSFINWIDHAMKLGRHSTTIEKLRSAAVQSITPESAGTFGAAVADSGRDTGGAGVVTKNWGYVSTIDVEKLNDAATEANCHIRISVRPGDYLGPGMCVATVLPVEALTDELTTCIVDAVDCDTERHVDIDIRFNIVNLTETADRALSPGVNDPGTAIYILNILAETIAYWSKAVRSPDALEVKYARVSMPALTAREIVNDGFTPIARDGAGAVEVGVRLHKVLNMLGALPHTALRVEVARMAQVAAELSDAALVSPAHKALVARARVFDQARQVSAP